MVQVPRPQLRPKIDVGGGHPGTLSLRPRGSSPARSHAARGLRPEAAPAAANHQPPAPSLQGEDLDDPTTWLRQSGLARRGDLRALPGEGAPKGRAATRDHRDPLETAARSRAHTAPLTDDGVGQGILAVVNRGQLRRTTLTLWGIEHAPKHNGAASSPERREARGTLLGMDDQQRIALVETRRVTTTGTTTTVHGHAPAPLVRFPLDVKITYTGNRPGDFDAPNKAAGLPETPGGFSWHHHPDGTTMQLNPKDIHAKTGQTGGFSNP